MNEKDTKERILGELSSTIASVNLEYLREDLADLGGADVDPEGATTLRDTINAHIKKLTEYLNLATEALGDKPDDRGDQRLLTRAEKLLSDVDGLPALLKEVEALMPVADVAAGLETEDVDTVFAELLDEVNDAKKLEDVKAATVQLFIFLKTQTDKKVAEVGVAAAEPVSLSKEDAAKAAARKKLGIESDADRQKRLVDSAEKAKTGIKGVKIKRLFERMGRVPLSIINTEASKRRTETKAVDRVLGESLEVVKSELSLRNTIEDFATGGSISLNTLSHQRDMLAFVRFLAEVKLIDGYDPKPLREEKIMKNSESVERATKGLVAAYEFADEPHEEKFKAYLKRQAPFFTEIFGGKVGTGAAKDVEEPAAVSKPVAAPVASEAAAVPKPAAPLEINIE